MIIPSFAVGRTQEILYFIREIKEKQLVTGHGDFPVYMDSPLAIEATSIFLQCDTDYLDEKMRAEIRAKHPEKIRVKNPVRIPEKTRAKTRVKTRAKIRMKIPATKEIPATRTPKMQATKAAHPPRMALPSA